MGDRPRILVCGNAGAAGRALLIRSDLDLYWALTGPEAKAVVKLEKPQVAITREWLAEDVLTASRKTPTIVLLEPEGWALKEQYFNKGATALVEATSARKLYEALSELTGRTFAKHQRVPFETVIDAAVANATQFLQSMDLSVSGVSVTGLPIMPKGTELMLEFDMLDPPLMVKGVVVRYFYRSGQQAAGLAFIDMDEHGLEQIAELIEQERKERALPDALEFAEDESEDVSYEDPTLTCDLMPPPEVPEFPEVRAVLLEEKSDVAPWIARACRDLTSIERAAALGEEVPDWATEALTGRLDIYSARSRAEGRNLTRSECKRAFELCQTLGRDAEGERSKVLVQVTEIRTALLRGLYGAENIGSSDI